VNQKEIEEIKKGCRAYQVLNVIIALEILGNAFYRAIKSIRDFNKIATILSEKEESNGRMGIGTGNS